MSALESNQKYIYILKIRANENITDFTKNDLVKALENQIVCDAKNFEPAYKKLKKEDNPCFTCYKTEYEINYTKKMMENELAYIKSIKTTPNNSSSIFTLWKDDDAYFCDPNVPKIINDSLIIITFVKVIYIIEEMSIYISLFKNNLKNDNAVNAKFLLVINKSIPNNIDMSSSTTTIK
ncbi:hypothetical protein COBT_001045 [Conglomerata obtusa]